MVVARAQKKKTEKTQNSAERSEGTAFRTDCPAKQPFWQCHSIQRLGREISTAPVGMGA